MSFRLLAMSMLMTGCGTMGLELLQQDSGVADGNSWLVVEPQSGLDFGFVDVQGNSGIETAVLTAKGSDQVVLIDIRFSATTDSSYSFVSDDLPLPHQLPVGVDFPVEVKFSPTHSDQYTGQLEIDIENEENSVDTLTLSIVGYGCDSGGPTGCP